MRRATQMTVARSVRTAPVVASGTVISASDFQIEGSGTTPSTVSLGTTPASGSALLVWSAADLSSIGAPTENKGNTLTLLESETYPSFPGYGFRLHGDGTAAGGASHTVSLAKTSNVAGESTLIALMVPGIDIADTSTVFRNAAGAGGDLVSASVTVPAGQTARLVSLWSGDGNSGTTDQTCNPESGWTTVQSLFLAGTAYIQAACAVKNTLVSAGTYTMIWRPVVNQGGIIQVAAVRVS